MSKNIVIYRILANLFDSVIVTSVGLLLLIPSLLSYISLMSNKQTLEIISLYISSFLAGAIFLIVLLIYFVTIPAHNAGQTFGKKIFRLKLKTIKGDDIDYKSMFLRTAMRLFLVFVSFGATIIIDFVSLVATKEHKTFYDVIASTYVDKA